MPRHVTTSRRACQLQAAPLSTSVRRRDGRRCAEKVPRLPVPRVGEAPRAVAGQAFGAVQDGIHVTGRLSSVVAGDRDQCVGHTKSSV